MSSPNNSTELNGRKELEVNLSNDFNAECEFGFLGWDFNDLGIINKVGSIKLKGKFKDMKPAGKLRPQTLKMIQERKNQKQGETTR